MAEDHGGKIKNEPRRSWMMRKRQERAAMKEGLAEWQANPYFCAGRVTVPALMDTVACQCFINTSASPVFLGLFSGCFLGVVGCSHGLPVLHQHVSSCSLIVGVVWVFQDVLTASVAYQCFITGQCFIGMLAPLNVAGDLRHANASSPCWSVLLPFLGVPILTNSWAASGYRGFQS